MTDEETRKQSTLYRLGTQEPRCAMCPESDWHCLDSYPTVQVGETKRSAILCGNCQLKLSIGPSDDGRRLTALTRLGTDAPHCAVCGESDWRCLDCDHMGDRAYNDQIVILCRNCHRRRSNPSANRAAPSYPPRLECAGRLVLGLASLLALAIPLLKDLGHQLLQAAKECPRPWGWLPPQPGLA
jgi:hypothetical protein